MGKCFGTDGFRGEANVNLTAEHAFQIGRFLGMHFGGNEKARIVIGKDTRRSGAMLESAILAGITASGVDAYFMGVTTTPSVAYAVRTEGFHCGVMISASHNPFYDNGIKLIGPSGTKISAEIEQKIEAYIDEGIPKIPLATGEHIGDVVGFNEGKEHYVEFLRSIPKHAFSGMKIALDCANGSTFELAAKVFEATGAQIAVLHAEPDGININTDCGSTHMESLQAYVKEHHMNMGFAFDGDGDRCLAVDEFGQVIDGDLILYICGKYLKEKGKLPENTIVATIMSNLGLYAACDRQNIRYQTTSVGDKYVAECMFRDGYALGGEQSGHIIFGEYATTGDGILTALMLAEAVANSGHTLSALASEVEIYPQILHNVRVTDKKAVRENAAVQAAAARIGDALGKGGRILVRESGTEPVIRIMVEAKELELCNRYVDEMLKVLGQEQLI